MRFLGELISLLFIAAILTVVISVISVVVKVFAVLFSPLALIVLFGGAFIFTLILVLIGVSETFG